MPENQAVRTEESGIVPRVWLGHLSTMLVPCTETESWTHPSSLRCPADIQEETSNKQPALGRPLGESGREVRDWALSVSTQH